MKYNPGDQYKKGKCPRCGKEKTLIGSDKGGLIYSCRPCRREDIRKIFNGDKE